MSEPSEQAAKILGPLSGTATVWAIDLGLCLSLFEYLAGRGTGATADEVAEDLDIDGGHGLAVINISLHEAAT